MTQVLFDPDLKQNQLKNAVAHTVTAPPANAKNGQWWFDSAADTWGIKLQRGFINILDRATHTGTITTTEISNFAAAVRLVRLDELAKPTAQVDMNSQRLRGLIAAANDDEPVRQAEFRQATLGYDWKENVYVASNGVNITLSGTQTVDGISVGNPPRRVLVKNQTTASQNGIWLTNSSGAWVRANDGLQDTLTSGAVVTVSEGSAALKGTAWRLQTSDPITVGTTAQTWVEFARPFVPAEGLGIKVTGATIAIDTAVVSRHVTGTIGDGVSTTLVWAHGLNNQWAVPYTCLAATGEKCEVDIENTDANTFTIRTTTPLPTGAVKISAHG